MPTLAAGSNVALEASAQGYVGVDDQAAAASSALDTVVVGLGSGAADELTSQPLTTVPASSVTGQQQGGGSSQQQSQSSFAVYACDIPTDMDDHSILNVFAVYGKICAFNKVSNTEVGQAIIIEYEEQQAAEEAQKMLNQSLIRDRTVRCLMMSGLRYIQETMVTGPRLMVERLDPSIESHRLTDVCGLWGQVLDCKVEEDDKGKSCGYGFVHYADAAGANRALENMNKIQIGVLHVELRPFEWKDALLFRGPLYMLDSVSQQRHSHMQQHHQMGAWSAADMSGQQYHAGPGGMGTVGIMPYSYGVTQQAW
eukprot:TRINITY_DN4687_c0_g1_i1.p1 TRINITY_DN4687_c0_g1~~TRINITY_DN4687_c0_g1_i1.p1  ORF type:complete len:311 (+),score=67.63 TRINITY_DN4687_c0_g1_i1:62-994(+)